MFLACVMVCIGLYGHIFGMLQHKLVKLTDFCLSSIYLYLLWGTHATELVLHRPGFFWPSNHRLHNPNSHVAD